MNFAGINVTILVETDGKIDPETGELDNSTLAIPVSLVMVKANGDEIQRLVLDELREFMDYDTTAVLPSEGRYFLLLVVMNLSS